MEPTKGFFTRPDIVDDKLYVVTAVYNPKRYRSRWSLYQRFEKYILANKEAHLVTIECSYGSRENCLTEKAGENHTVIHVSTDQEIWLKENLINLAIERLPEDWKYVAWIDCDVQFARPDWVGEAIQQLQHYQVVQMWSESADLSPTFEIIKTHKSFMASYVKNGYKGPKFSKAYPGAYFHPGFAWCARREAIDHLGQLIDWAILGGGDMYMAYALIGALDSRTMPRTLGKRGIEQLKEWQVRAEKHIKRNVGYMDGLILHYFHGSKRDRAYKDRGQILLDAKFEPNTDLKKDWQGLWQLTGDNLALRDGARSYFSQRNEDSIEV